MNFQNPVVNPRLPKFHEGSRQRPQRDADANAQAWKRNRAAVQSNQGLVIAVNRIQKQVATMRRRIVGGGGGSSGTIAFRGEYDPAASYKLLEVVVISLGSSSGTYVCINQAGATGIAPFTGGNTWAQLPQGQLGAWL